MRIGHGYDVHRLVEGRKLILGGVQIEYDKGLDGHSDADVLTHAIMDAHPCAVDIDRGLVIYGSEMQQDVLACPLGRYLYGTMVPDGIDKIGEADPRQLTFRAKGDGYLIFESSRFIPIFIITYTAKIEGISPGAVQVFPLSPFKLRAWILGPWGLCAALLPSEQECQYGKRGCSEKSFHCFCSFYFKGFYFKTVIFSASSRE